MNEASKMEGLDISMWKAYWNAMVNGTGHDGETLEEAKARLKEQGFREDGSTTGTPNQGL